MATGNFCASSRDKWEKENVGKRLTLIRDVVVYIVKGTKQQRQLKGQTMNTLLLKALIALVAQKTHSDWMEENYVWEGDLIQCARDMFPAENISPGMIRTAVSYLQDAGVVIVDAYPDGSPYTVRWSDLAGRNDRK